MLDGKKTYLTALAAVLTAWAAFLNGSLPLKDAIEGTFAAVLACFLRHGITTRTPAILPLLCCALFLPGLTGCTGLGANGDGGGSRPGLSFDLLSGACVTSGDWRVCYQPLTRTVGVQSASGAGGITSLSYNDRTGDWRSTDRAGNTLVYDAATGRVRIEPALPRPDK